MNSVDPAFGRLVAAASPARAVLWSGALALGLVGLALGLNGVAGPDWHAATRVTAVFAFPFWLLAFTASSLERFFPSAATRGLRRRRRAIGLAFATTQAIHGLAILALARVEPGVLDPDLSVVGGGVGFVLIAAMAATSNDASQRWLGATRWRALHRTGQLFVFVVYLVTYGGRVAEDASFWPGLALVLGAGALRLSAAVYALRLRSSTLPTE